MAETEPTIKPESADAAEPTANERVAKPAPKARKKKVKRSVPFAHIKVMASFNNTIITITDTNGEALTYSSAGACGFRGSKKGTAYAAQVASEKAIYTAKQQFGMSRAHVYIKGVGLGRESAVRALAAADVNVESITDVTTIPHGGVRPKKARRV